MILYGLVNCFFRYFSSQYRPCRDYFQDLMCDFPLSIYIFKIPL